MNLYIKLSVCVPRLIPGRGFYAQISSEIISEFPGVTSTEAHNDNIDNRVQIFNYRIFVNNKILQRWIVPLNQK